MKHTSWPLRNPWTRFESPWPKTTFISFKVCFVGFKHDYMSMLYRKIVHASLHNVRNGPCFDAPVCRYCESRRRVLLQHVHEGYDKDLWEYIEDWGYISTPQTLGDKLHPLERYNAMTTEQHRPLLPPPWHTALHCIIFPDFCFKKSIRVNYI